MPAARIALFALLGVLLAAPAQARVLPVAPIDAGSELAGLGGVAMAGDGTGGIVYRKRVDGRTHIFAAQFIGGAWLAPRRVDAGQSFDSSWPAIGAGERGRLVVTWVQESGPADRMYSAALDPGARSFQAPVPVDLNVGDATAIWPSVAMARGGAAYLTYLVTGPAAGAPVGYVRGELRVARYTGALWSGFGSPMNRNPASPVRAPSANNRPRIGIDLAGNGVLAWQEPDDALIDRIWARRLFGSTPGLAQQVSPGTFDGAAVRAPADAFGLDVAGFGQAAVSWRQQAETAAGPVRLYAATLPETTLEAAATFSAPRDLALPAQGGAPGPPSVAVAAGGAFTAAFGVGTAVDAIDGDDAGVDPVTQLDDGGSAVPGDPQVDIARSGAAAIAARAGAGGRGGLALIERRSDGVVEQRTVSGAAGGEVAAFALSGSGLGDALVGFEQGSGAGAQIVAGGIDAPPEAFAVQTPVGWVRRAPLELRWDRPGHAVGGVRFAITVDDDTVAEELASDRHVLPRRALDDGIAVVQVIAEDDGGQETTSFPAELKVDGRPPRVKVSRTGRTLRVLVADGRKRRVSGVDPASVKVRFGSGRTFSGKAKVVRAVPGGRVRVSVAARDKAGNRARVTKTVIVP